MYGDYVPRIVSRIRAQPTIDPETLPIVRELREKLEQVTAERDAAVADCFKFIDSKGVVNALEKDKKGEVHTRAICFFGVGRLDRIVKKKINTRV